MFMCCTAFHFTSKLFPSPPSFPSTFVAFFLDACLLLWMMVVVGLWVEEKLFGKLCEPAFLSVFVVIFLGCVSRKTTTTK